MKCCLTGGGFSVNATQWDCLTEAIPMSTNKIYTGAIITFLHFFPIIFFFIHTLFISGAIINLPTQVPLSDRVYPDIQVQV